MTASGIPPHISQQRQIDRLVEENKILRTQLEQQHKEVMTKLPDCIKDKILENVNITGAQQVSMSSMRSVMEELLTQYNVGASSSSATATATAPIQGEQEGYQTFIWGGMMGRPVPHEWEFPRCGVKQTCDLFMFGIHELRIRPFWKIIGNTLRRQDQSYFYKAEFVFRHIIGTAIEEKLTTEEDWKNMTVLQWDEVFVRAYAAELGARPTKVRKPGEISVITYYDKLKGRK